MRKLPLLFFAAAVLAGASPGLGSGLVNPFSRYGAKPLNDTDSKLLTGAVTKALEERKAGATASWSDDATGRAGQATVLQVYQKNGADCGKVRHAYTRGEGQAYTLPFCLQKDGSWKIQF